MSVKDVETFPSESPEHLSFSAQDRLDRACDRFEASRRAGERPRIEEYYPSKKVSHPCTYSP